MHVKIIFRGQILILSLLLLSHYFAAFGQDTILNKYGLWVINDIKTLRATIIKDPGKQMIDLQKFIPAIYIDLKYAGPNNFMHKKLYKNATATFLRMPAASALQQVQIELSASGLALKVFDAYRPYAVTLEMWEPIKDDRYVADPKIGSGHNRGIAVDITLIDLHTKKELDMGTGFDNFSDTAHQTFTALPAQIIKNRKLLKSVMEKHGFKALDSEWWHYSLPNAKDFELLNVSFKSLEKMKH
ncbi:MAG: M15 family metallopeptidase [Chitinophagaceae bacterium]|nr:M15 family metallopeptidase [Chitinophagaceae bacterium]